MKNEEVTLVDMGLLESLIGYNARRAAVPIISRLMQEFEALGLGSVVEFSVLSLIHHNPGITASQLCQSLDIQAPNLATFINRFLAKGWVNRQSHPSDGRAWSLHLTVSGTKLLVKAEDMAQQTELQAASKLKQSEIKTLISLLQKIYL